MLDKYHPKTGAISFPAVSTSDFHHKLANMSSSQRHIEYAITLGGSTPYPIMSGVKKQPVILTYCLEIAFDDIRICHIVLCM